MKKKPKAQGTEFETFLVKHFREAGLVSERLAEGGIADLGDLKVEAGTLAYPPWADAPGDCMFVFTEPFVVEARHRENMPVHTALEEARLKAGNHPVALIWKRTKRKDGNARRSAVGVGTVVVLDLETFTALIGGHSDQPQTGDRNETRRSQ